MLDKDIILKITLANKATDSIYIPPENLHAVLKYIARDTDRPELVKIKCHQSFSIPAKYYLGGPVQDLPATQILLNTEFHKTLPQFITATHNCKHAKSIGDECHGQCDMCHEVRQVTRTIDQYCR